MDCIGLFLEWYGQVIHPPLVVVLCCAGSAGHLLSIHTLVSVINPTNMLLISMSCSQLLLCANFLYATLFKWASDQLCEPFFFSKGMAMSLHFSVHLSVILHMAGVFHVVALSLIRFYTLKRVATSCSSVPLLTYPICKKAIISIYCGVFFIGIPLFFTSEIRMEAEKSECVHKIPSLKGTPSFVLTFSSRQYLQTLNFWLFNLSAKIIPSIVLCLMTWLILEKLKQLQKISSRFTTSQKDRQHHRTTIMILTIMFMFILVELPQGILAVVSTFIFMRIMDQLGDLNEMLTLLTSCVIFALFCSTSGKVREAVLELPCIRLFSNSRPPKGKSLRRSLNEEKQLLEVTTPEIDTKKNYTSV